MTEDLFIINEDFRIEKTKNNFTLQENKVVIANRDSADHKKGDEYKTWTDAGHYMSIKGALKAFVVKFTDRSAGVGDILARFERLEELYSTLKGMG